MGFRNIFSSSQREGAQPDPSELASSEAENSPDQERTVYSLSETEPYSDFRTDMDQISIPEDPIELAHDTDELSGQVDQFQDSLDSDSNKKGAFGRWGSKKGGSAGFISKLFSRDRKKIEGQQSLSDASAEIADDLAYPAESDEATLGEQTEDRDGEDDREERLERNIYLRDGDDISIVTEENIKALRNIAAFDTAGSYDKKEEEKFTNWLKKREKSSGLSKMMKDHYGYLKQTLIENNKKIDAEYQQLESQSTPDCIIYRNSDETFSLLRRDSSQPKGLSEDVFTSWAEAKQEFLKRKGEKREADLQAFEILQKQNNETVSIQELEGEFVIMCPNEAERGDLFYYTFNNFNEAKDFFEKERLKHPIVRQPIANVEPITDQPLPSDFPPVPDADVVEPPRPLSTPQRGFQSFGGGGAERASSSTAQDIGVLKKDFLPNFLIKDMGDDTFEVVSPLHYDKSSQSFVGGKNTKKFTNGKEATAYFLKEKKRLIDSGLSFNKKDLFDLAA